MQKYLYYDIKIDLEINLKSSYDMATQATRRDGSIAPTHSQPGTRRKWVVGFSRFTHVKETVRFVQKASGTRGRVWTALKISPLDRPAPGESLYPPLSRSMLQIFLSKKATPLTTHVCVCYLEPFIARSYIHMWVGIA